MYDMEDLIGFDRCPHCKKKIQFLCKTSHGTIAVFKEEWPGGYEK